MLGALALIPMRQQQDQRGLDSPLGAGGADELVDHHLGAVGEVTELAFPEHEAPRGLHTVAIFEPDCGFLGKRAVIDREGRLGGWQRGQWRVRRTVDTVQDQMALTEGAALGVLAGQANRGAVRQDRGESKRFGMRPIDLAIGRIQHMSAPIPLPGELRRDGESVRNGVDIAVIFEQRFFGHAGVDSTARRWWRNVFAEISGAVGHRAANAGQAVQGALQHRVGFARFDLARRQELLGEEIAHRRMLVDDLVHHRLGEGRFVALVVSPAPVADQVDQEVLTEDVAIFDRHAHRGQAAFRIVGIDMYDRNLEALGQVTGIAGGTRIARRGREPDLIVRDDVDRAAGGVAGQRRQIQRLGHDALPREGGIAMDEDGHAGLVVPHRFARFVGDILRSAHHPFDHGVDRFEMARVRRERQGNLDHVTLLATHQAARRGGISRRRKTAGPDRSRAVGDAIWRPRTRR